MLSVEMKSGRNIIALISPPFLVVSYRLLLEVLFQLTSYAWIICNAFYYLLCLLFVMLLSESSLKVLLSSLNLEKWLIKGIER